MSRWAKVGVVLAGYAAAIVAGTVAGQMYNARMAKMPYDTSGGMYAAGEMMSSLAAFLFVAFFPTVLALWFLRRNHKFWTLVAVSSVVFAGVGLAAVLTPLVYRETPTHVPGMIIELVRLSQLLGVPLWFGAFAFCAFLAPSRQSRVTLLAATAIELVIGVCAIVHWFLPRPPL